MGGVAGAHVVSDGTSAEAQLLQNQTELSERFSFNRRLSVSIYEDLRRGLNKNPMCLPITVLIIIILGGHRCAALLCFSVDFTFGLFSSEMLFLGSSPFSLTEQGFVRKLVLPGHC